MTIKRLIVVMALTALLMVNVGLSFGQSKDIFKTENQAYVMKVEKMTNDKLYLYDIKHKENVVINWYCETSEFKDFRTTTWYYNYKDDILFMVKDGVLYDMNYGL